MLAACRGYPASALFTGFPSDVCWRRVELEPGDLHRMTYANHTGWIDLSGGTRRVVDAAANLDRCKDEKLAAQILEVAGRIRNGDRFPELIAMEEGDGAFALFEGHTRATSYAAVRPACNIPFIIGTSKRACEWYFYPGR